MGDGNTPDAQHPQPDPKQRFSAFYRVQHGKALALVRLRAVDCDAEALVADAFELVWKQMLAGREPNPGWFFQVVRNKIGDFYRSARRRESATCPDALPEAGTDDDTKHSELRVDVRRVLSGLPPRYREPLVLVHWLDLSNAEAAQALGIRDGTFRVRLHRAHQAFLYEFDSQHSNTALNNREEVIAWIEQNG